MAYIISNVTRQIKLLANVVGFKRIRNRADIKERKTSYILISYSYFAGIITTLPYSRSTIQTNLY